jgi:hypothetical protein
MSYLQEIPKLNFSENTGGLFTIQVARISDIENIPEIKDGIIAGEITFKPGKGFFNWSATYNSARFISENKGSQEGNYKEFELPFIIPGDRPEFYNMLMKAEMDAFVILYKDGNGRMKICGNKEEPVYFQFSVKTGGGVRELNGYECRFFGNKTAFYTGLAPAPDSSVQAPVIIRKGSSSGPIVAVLEPGQEFIITSGFSFGFRII